MLYIYPAAERAIRHAIALEEADVKLRVTTGDQYGAACSAVIRRMMNGAELLDALDAEYQSFARTGEPSS